MKHRMFGRTGLSVSELGMGCAALGGGLYGRDDREVIATLEAAFEAGITFYDTANTYSAGRSERLLGRTFKSRRRRVFITSKGGIVYHPVMAVAIGMKSWLKPVKELLRPMQARLNRAKYAFKHGDFSPRHIERALAGSLKRLQTDYLDLYQLHNPPPEVLARGEIFEALERFKTQGKIRQYGVSFKTVKDAEAVSWAPGLSAIQVPLNLLDQEVVSRVLPLARERGIAVIARVPLAQGLLTDASEVKAEQIAVDPDAVAQRKRRAEAFHFLATGQRTLAQAALQFVLQLPGVSVVIPGMTKRRRLEANLGALAAPPLTNEELERVAHAV